MFCFGYCYYIVYFQTIYGSILHNFDHASHMVMMEQPKRVNNVLKAFITGVATEHSLAQSAAVMESTNLSNGAAAHAQNGDVAHTAGNDVTKMAACQATPTNDDDISSIQSCDRYVVGFYKVWRLYSNFDKGYILLCLFYE